MRLCVSHYKWVGDQNWFQVGTVETDIQYLLQIPMWSFMIQIQVTQMSTACCNMWGEMLGHILHKPFAFEAPWLPSKCQPLENHICIIQYFPQIYLLSEIWFFCLSCCLTETTFYSIMLRSYSRAWKCGVKHNLIQLYMVLCSILPFHNYMYRCHYYFTVFNSCYSPLSHPILFYLILCYPILSCPILSYPSYPILS